MPKKDEPVDESDKSAMKQKIINDAVAYIRSLAELHGRNQDWAEKAVREAASLPASEALSLNVIDIIAAGLADLLKQVDGREVMVLGHKRTLHVAGLPTRELLPDWRSRFLSVITNPNVAYILMMIGIYGLILEFSNPGAIVPGTVGAISLLLALYAFQLLPINYAGMALILLGVALMVGEAFEPSFGILGIGGVVAFVFGSIILIDTKAPGFGIDISVIVTFAGSYRHQWFRTTGNGFHSQRTMAGAQQNPFK
jgi:membrane-bound serine protease (ClpP class)